MTSKRNRFWSHDNRFRLMLTLGLAVLLPAAALIYVNFHHLKSIKRDKVLEAIIHRDFQYVLAVSEKKLNQKAYTMTEEVRDLFPSPDNDTESDKERKLDLILSKNPWVSHVFLFDREKGLIFRSQPQQMSDNDFREEHERTGTKFQWSGSAVEGKMLVEEMHKKTRPFTWYSGHVKRAGGDALHDDCLLRVTATLQGSRRDGRSQLRSRLPEANLLSGNARRADCREAN